MQLTALIEQAKIAAVAAGNAILNVYRSETFDVELKGDNSPLTLADQASHQVIMSALESTGLPVLSEEGKSVPYEERSKWAYFWLVDPLDGTKEFIKRNGEFTVNIALIERNIVIGGVVYVPVAGKLYWALNGNGAFFQNGNQDPSPLKIDKEKPVEVIVASRSHMGSETAEFISRYPKAETLSIGSSLKFLLVAEGKAQLYPRFAPTLEPVTYNRENLLNGWFLVSNRKLA
jgi:3'(2'), 5'-bisphosphate nucleotidase